MSLALFRSKSSSIIFAILFKIWKLGRLNAKKGYGVGYGTLYIEIHDLLFCIIFQTKQSMDREMQ